MSGLAEQVHDPILDQMIQQIEAQLPPGKKADYQAIVVSGMKMLFHDTTHKYLQKAVAQGQVNPPTAVKGVVSMLAVIYQHSNQRMSIPMAVPAGITLLCHILDYAEKASGAQTDRNTLAQMVHALTIAILKFFKIDQNKLAAGADYAKAHPDQFGGTKGATTQPSPQPVAVQPAPQPVAPQGA